VVLEDGEIVEVGTHQSLLEKNGLYAEMYRRQQEQDRKVHAE
jgi:ABC-type multidrug transport system fused ATPase/permease subunit